MVAGTAQRPDASTRAAMSVALPATASARRACRARSRAAQPAEPAAPSRACAERSRAASRRRGGGQAEFDSSAARVSSGGFGAVDTRAAQRPRVVTPRKAASSLPGCAPPDPATVSSSAAAALRAHRSSVRSPTCMSTTLATPAASTTPTGAGGGTGTATTVPFRSETLRERCAQHGAGDHVWTTRRRGACPSRGAGGRTDDVVSHVRFVPRRAPGAVCAAAAPAASSEKGATSMVAPPIRDERQRASRRPIERAAMAGQHSRAGSLSGSGRP